MKELELIPREHDARRPDPCPHKEPNILEDTLLTFEGQLIGFYIHDLGDSRLSRLLTIADAEFNSDRVHKTVMNRINMDGLDGETGKWKYKNVVKQQSALLGAMAPNPLKRRPYPTKSMVHGQKSAQTFIQAMLGCCGESEDVLREMMPKQYGEQESLITRVEEKWRFGRLFTSSISNYNIAANYHRDIGNIEGTVNIILTKRNGADGGCLHVPDYGLTFAQGDNSMLVYPAWRNLHGVTPIVQTAKDGYRNSYIFYALKAFLPK